MSQLTYQLEGYGTAWNHEVLGDWVLLPTTTMPLDPILTRYCLDINQYHMLCSLLKIPESIPLRLTEGLTFRD